MRFGLGKERTLLREKSAPMIWESALPHHAKCASSVCKVRFFGVKSALKVFHRSVSSIGHSFVDT